MRRFLPHLTRRRAVAGGILAAALGLIGSAFGHAGFGPFAGGSTAVSATFYANTSVNSKTQTCTANNGDPIDITQATFTGTATSSTASLNGPLSVSVKTVYDTKTNLGSLTGQVTIGSPPPPPSPGSSPPSPPFKGTLEAIDSNGAVQGLLEGNAGGARFLANVTATYSGSGFNSSTSQGTIGSGTGTDTGLMAAPGGCAPPSTPNQPSHPPKTPPLHPPHPGPPVTPGHGPHHH